MSQAKLPGARFHGSVLSGIKGGEYLRDNVRLIRTAHVLPLANGVFAALNILVEDDREAHVALRPVKSHPNLEPVLPSRRSGEPPFPSTVPVSGLARSWALAFLMGPAPEPFLTGHSVTRMTRPGESLLAGSMTTTHQVLELALGTGIIGQAQIWIRRRARLHRPPWTRAGFTPPPCEEPPERLLAFGAGVAIMTPLLHFTLFPWRVRKAVPVLTQAEGLQRRSCPSTTLCSTLGPGPEFSPQPGTRPAGTYPSSSLESLQSSLSGHGPRALRLDGTRSPCGIPAGGTVREPARDVQALTGRRRLLLGLSVPAGGWSPPAGLPDDKSEHEKSYPEWPICSDKSATVRRCGRVTTSPRWLALRPETPQRPTQWSADSLSLVCLARKSECPRLSLPPPPEPPPVIR